MYNFIGRTPKNGHNLGLYNIWGDTNPRPNQCETGALPTAPPQPQPHHPYFLILFFFFEVKRLHHGKFFILLKRVSDNSESIPNKKHFFNFFQTKFRSKPGSILLPPAPQLSVYTITLRTSSCI